MIPIFSQNGSLPIEIVEEKGEISITVFLFPPTFDGFIIGGYGGLLGDNLHKAIQCFHLGVVAGEGGYLGVGRNS
ncbi:MAG: hypothetical protein R2795_03835 [Saprospiraceae bacterium]